MKKEEFLKQLEQLLSGISEEEKADAIAYYRNYFEDAGEENEEAVAAELESPQKAAESIRKNLGLEGNGSYYNSTANRDEEYYRNVNSTIQNLQEKKKADKQGWSALTITLLILTSPLWLTLLVVLIAVLIGVAAVLLGTAAAVVSVMAALAISGFVVLGVGVGLLFSASPVVGIAFVGVGFLILALAVLAVVLVVWMFGGFLPWAWKGIVNLCKKLFRRGKEYTA